MKLTNFGDKFRLGCSMLASVLINAFRNPANLSYSNILCIKTDEIGDMIYSTHVFRMLKKQYPKAEITVLCKSYCKPLLIADTNVDHIALSTKELKGRYDLIVDLQCTWKSIWFGLRKWPQARLDRGTVRTAHSFQGKYLHEVETNYHVIEPLISKQNRSLEPSVSLSDDDRKVAANLILENKLNHFALLHTEARRELRKWPAASFREIAKYLHSEKGMQIVFLGGPGEEEEVEKVRQGLPFTTYSTAGKLSLTATAALMEKASLYIGNESGPLHLAAVMKVPCLGLYGPGPQHIFYPYGSNTDVLHHVLECNPCDQIHCVHRENPCIQRISVKEVIDKINVLLSREQKDPAQL